MREQTPPTEDRDRALWQIARKRAAFKIGLVTYLIVNIFLWILWYFTGGQKDHRGIPWPVWTTLGWGVAVLFQYANAYIYPRTHSTEREYEKLKNKQS